MTLEPIDLSEEIDNDRPVLIVSLKSIGNLIAWELALELPEHENVSLEEIRALKDGAAAAILKFEELIRQVESESDSPE